jgi:glycine/D-amino acid oxidase-like deaminating enzyme
MSRTTTDIAIIGAGIMGLATAFQIARRSNERVTVLERGGGPGEGSTGASSAIIRQRYTHPEVIRIARGGLIAFRNWQDFTGIAEPRASLQEIGVLWMTGEDRGTVEAERVRLEAEGVRAVVLDAKSLREQFPGLSACGVPFDLTGEIEHHCADHGAFLLEDEGGYFDPAAACGDLTDAARREGVDIIFRSEVAGIAKQGDRIVGVELADGTTLSAGTVVNAAGPWCNGINEMAGLDLSWDLVPTRIQAMYRALPPEVPLPLPVVADAASGIYLRPESAGQQLVVGSVREEDEREEADPDSFNANADRAFLDSIVHGLHHRLPDLPHRGLLSGIAGLYTINRIDVHPVLGPTELDGFVIMNGFSGHGFKESLMCGGMLAAWLTGASMPDDPAVPLEFFSVDREPLTVREKNVLA